VLRGRKKRKAEAAAAVAAVAAGAESSPPKAKGRRVPKGPARQTRLTRLVGLALCLGGFAAIAVGWAGAASKDCVPCQMPYLLSGGAAGIGLIAFGVGMMVLAQLRTEGRRLANRLEEWRSSAVATGSSTPPGNEELPVATREVPPAVATPNGEMSITARPQPQQQEVETS
jgi:hypothetical protein